MRAMSIFLIMTLLPLPLASQQNNNDNSGFSKKQTAGLIATVGGGILAITGAAIREKEERIMMSGMDWIVEEGNEDISTAMIVSGSFIAIVGLIYGFTNSSDNISKAVPMRKHPELEYDGMKFTFRW